MPGGSNVDIIFKHEAVESSFSRENVYISKMNNCSDCGFSSFILQMKNAENQKKKSNCSMGITREIVIYEVKFDTHFCITKLLACAKFQLSSSLNQKD